jgi:4-carboxymuconolactone decarboxylase
MSETDDRITKGRALAAKLFAGAERRASATMPKTLQDYTFGHLFGDVWQGEDLALEERSLITCTTLVALNRLAEQRVHFVGAKNLGIPRAKIEAMITHLAHYAGWPCAASAVQVLNEVWPPDAA